MKRGFFFRIAAMMVVSACAFAQFKEEDPSKPAILQGIGFDQRLNWQVPADASFRDENGRTVRLAEFFGARPAVLVLVYYACPSLCTEVLNATTSALRAVSFDPGKEFDVVVISIDPREQPPLAAEKKAKYLKSYARSGTDAGWHFLTGDEDQIRAVASAVGFRYRYDKLNDQYVHATGIMVLTPQGRVSHYFYGVEYAPKDLRLALVEASHNKIGSAVDQILLFCYHYDPKQGRYTPVILNIVRAGGVLTLASLGTFLFVMFRQEARARRRSAA